MMPVVSGQVRDMLVLGGPVVWILVLLSVIALAAVFYKLWQYREAGLGRHRPLDAALALWDAGQGAQAQEGLSGAGSGLTPVLMAALGADQSTAAMDRVDAQANAALARLETGFASWMQSARQRRCWACSGRCWA